MDTWDVLLEQLERLAIVLDFVMPGCAELVRKAIFLLKEQEAKTVLNIEWHKVGNNKVFFGNCPNCQRRLYAKTSNYCQYCGQKLRWEDSQTWIK